MTAFEIDLPAIRAAAVQLGAAATAVGDGARVLAQLHLEHDQVGDPDGAVVAHAVGRYAERAARRLDQSGGKLRSHSVHVRAACSAYRQTDQATAARLRDLYRLR